VIIEFGFEAFQYLILVIPILVLFLSFLLCESVYDLDSKKWNEPWLFLIVLIGFVFIYLAFIGYLGGDTNVNENALESKSDLAIILPITLYLLYFIFIQAKLNYLYHNAYNEYKKKTEKPVTKKKEIIAAKSKTKESGTDVYEETEDLDQQELVEQRTSWALFFGALIFIILSFIFNEIVMMELARIIGFLILIAIPIIIIIQYIHYSTQNSSKNSNGPDDIDDIDNIDNIDNIDGMDDIDNIDRDSELLIDDPDFVAPNPILPVFLFISLIIFGFVIIIYYSALEQLSNIMVQSFILMIWIILFYGFYNIGIPRGGADTKALMALVILFPIYPIIQNITQNTSFFKMLEQFPVTAYIFPFVFTVLINASFVVLFFVIILLFYNISKGDMKFPNAVLGYRIPIEQVPKKFVWLMERIVDDQDDVNKTNKTNKTNETNKNVKKPKLEPFPKDQANLTEELKLFKRYGIKKVWVTPKIPFMIPLTMGLIITLIIGNIIFLIIGLLI
jgi:preflagellin peptidase FlaK